MAAPDQVGPVQEYQILRQELLESKRYVFERPLLIATAGIAALGAVKGGYIPAVPLFMAIFLLFNFWFTVNRLHSAARIIAYIQVELEEKRSCGRESKEIESSGCTCSPRCHRARQLQ